MKKIVPIKMGKEALDFMRGRLKCGYPLSEFLLQRPDLEEGEIVSFLPEGFVLKDPRQLEEGGILKADKSQIIRVPGGRMEPILDTNNDVAPYIKKWMESDTQKICVFDDAYRRTDKGDFSGFVNGLNYKILVADKRIYHCLTHDTLSFESLDLILRLSNAIWHQTGVLVRSHLDLSEKITEITSEDLGLFAQNAEKIIVGAYDGESYLVWERKP